VNRNRSAPPASITPVLTYPDVDRAVDWLTHVFGFIEHTRIGDHRAQLGFGDGAFVVADATNDRRPPRQNGITHSVLVRVDDVDRHHEHVRAAGADIVSAPQTHMYGERQYAVVDLAGHHWTFTQSVADISPEEWGGVTVAAW
jgi:uncharacterized glyoxalase superfamily protein PhnB